jgi:hypothetical protein
LKPILQGSQCPPVVHKCHGVHAVTWNPESLAKPPAQGRLAGARASDDQHSRRQICHPSIS